MIEILNTIQEIWRPIINYEGLYEVSNYGRVKRLMGYHSRKNKILKLAKQHASHLRVTLCKNGKIKRFQVHRLVLEAFVGPCPNGMESCHNDGNPSNNFIENLRYDTHKSNIQDSKLHKTLYVLNKTGEKHPASKMNNWQIRIIRRLSEDNYLTQREIAKIFKCSQANICNIINNKTWKYILVENYDNINK